MSCWILFQELLWGLCSPALVSQRTHDDDRHDDDHDNHLSPRCPWAVVYHYAHGKRFDGWRLGDRDVCVGGARRPVVAIEGARARTTRVFCRGRTIAGAAGSYDDDGGASLHDIANLPRRAGRLFLMVALLGLPRASR